MAEKLKHACIYSDILENEHYQLSDDVSKVMINSTMSNADLPPIQQSDLMKKFLLEIGEYGLDYVFHKYCHRLVPELAREDPDKYKYGKTKHPIKIIIVGAGPSGLAAAFELSRVGHHVTILEMQHHVGGHVKTISDEAFYKGPGMWSDSKCMSACHFMYLDIGGAMRLPGTGAPGWKGPSHFMTDFYAQKFDIPRKQFVNETKNGYYYFYGKSVKISGTYCM